MSSCGFPFSSDGLGKIYRLLQKHRSISELSGHLLIAFSDRDLVGKAGIIFEFGEKFLWKANWNATSDTSVKKGRAVKIIAVEGLTTKVKPET